MAQLDGNSKVVKVLINNDLQYNVDGSGVEGLLTYRKTGLRLPQTDIFCDYPLACLHWVADCLRAA